MKKQLMAAAISTALGLGMSANAHAGAYAVSFDEITNFTISTIPAGAGIGASSVNSNATACLPNGSCVSTGGAGVIDAAPAQIGIVRANNDYSFAGITAFNYARA